MYDEVPFSTLLGKTLTAVHRVNDEEIRFQTSEGHIYSMRHEQDCCEHVYIDSIVGNLDDLVGEPILMADEATNDSVQPGQERVETASGQPARGTPFFGVPVETGDSFTWTFYKLATVLGYVDIRWYGSSNGYYSESVSLIRVA